MIPVALCLAGMSPAVVTETLYALSVLARPRIIPKRICVLTTEDAWPLIVSSLLGAQGAITRLRSEYRLPSGALQCCPDDVVILRARSGRPMRDIRTSADSRAAGEAIFEILARLHADPEIELHCSIAGGRKTMGALLALALQMCARPGDRLYHVLINEPFERISEFFYPPRKRFYYRVAGRSVDSTRARVELAEIPLIRLGAVSESLGLGAGDLARRARGIESAVLGRFRLPRLRIDVSQCLVESENAGILLPPQEFALYLLYARLRQTCVRCAGAQSAGCAACHPTDAEICGKHRQRLLCCYRECRSEGGDRLVHLLSDGSGSARSHLDLDDWLRQTRSRLSRRLRGRWAQAGVCGSLLIVKPAGPELERENRRGITLAPGRINISNVEAPGAQR